MVFVYLETNELVQSS